MKITSSVYVPRAELSFSAIRAAGPGGQHVNKTSTAIELRFDARSSVAFDATQRARVLAFRDRRINADGVIVIKAQRARSQAMNRADASGRLTALLKQALEIDPPRITTQPTKAQKAKRREDKTHRSRLKSSRRRPDT